MKFKNFFLLTALFPFIAIGQVTLPKIIPPSPQSAQFVKYVDFTADLSIGLPSVSIPIYTVKSSELSFPISLSYDASGVKPNDDESGLIGLKWSLNAFGAVTRSISNKADEKHWDEVIPLQSDITSNTNNLVADPSTVTLLNLTDYNKDASPDIFSYRFPSGEGGKFVFPRSSNTISDFINPITLPYAPVKIAPGIPIQNDKNNIEFDNFEITDTQGVLHRFGKNLANSASAFEQANGVNNTYTGTGRTAWFLTEMISASKKDTIFFEYDDVLFPCSNGSGGCTTNYKVSPNHKAYRTFSYIYPTGFSPSFNQLSVNNAFYYSQKKITKIKFKLGYVTFSYQYINNQCLLQYIKIFSNNNTTQPLQTYKFNQSQFSGVATNEINWYKLDKLEMFNAASIKDNEYNFDYYKTNSPVRASGTSTYGQYTFAVDFWGYYNGQNNNAGLIPNSSGFSYSPAPNYEVYTGSFLGNREPNYNYSQSGILKTIKYPTGGIRTFTYEGNASYGNQKGGLRVKTISNTTNSTDTSPIIHTFDYGLGGDSVGNDNRYYEDYSISLFGSSGSSGSANDRSETFSVNSSPNIDINLQGMPIIYTDVIEYVGTSSVNTGSVRHLFDTSYFNLVPQPIVYSISMGYPWSSGLLSFNNPKPKFFFDKKFGKVFEKSTIYLDSQNQIVRSEEKQYTHAFQEVLKGFDVSRIVSGIQTSGRDKAYFYYFNNYSVNQLRQKLESVTTKEYENNVATITTTETYLYNDQLQVSSKQSTGSLGEVLKTEYKYPTDLVGVEQTPYMSNLVNANRISDPVITKSFNGTQKVSENHIKYNNSTFTSGILLPIEVHSRKGDGDINISTLDDRKLTYNQYDSSGNLTEYQLENGSPVAIIWGYKNLYPIAKIEGATYSQVGGSYATNLQSASNNNTLTQSSFSTLRNAFPSYMITTYIYSPLIGLTSVSNPNGVIITYEYDSSGRLFKTKDGQGNILSENKYNYKQ